MWLLHRQKPLIATLKVLDRRAPSHPSEDPISKLPAKRSPPEVNPKRTFAIGGDGKSGESVIYHAEPTGDRKVPHWLLVAQPPTPVDA